MRAVLRLLFLVPIGFVLACFAGAFALIWPFLAVGREALADPVVMFELAVGFTTLAAQIGWTALLPFCVFLVLSEALRLRSVLIHLLAGLAGGAIAAHRGPPTTEMSVQTATIAAGLAFALTYWLVAGNGAGLGRRRPAPRPRPLRADASSPSPSEAPSPSPFKD